MIDGRSVEIDLVCRRPHLNLTCGARATIRNSDQRYELALGVGVPIDVPLGGLN